MRPRILIALAAAALLGPWSQARGAEEASRPVETAVLVDESGPARLVVAHWPRAGWSVRQSGRTAEVILSRSAVDLDLSAIPRPAFEGRLLDVRAMRDDGGARLVLELGCDCRLALHGDGETRLAIDIVSAELAAGPTVRSRGPAPRIAPSPPPRRDVARDTAQKDETPGTAEPRQAPGETAGSDATVKKARQRLLEQLESAAEAGLIELSDPRSDARVNRGARPADPAREGLRDARSSSARPREASSADATVRDETGGRRQGGSTEAGTPEAAAVARQAKAGQTRSRETPLPANAAIENVGAEDAARERVEAPPPLTSPTECPAPAVVRLPPVLAGESFAQRRAELRGRLLGEFDAPAPDAATELARFYIAHEMGAEARAVMERFSSQDPALAFLTGMASVVEGRRLQPDHPLRARDCDGPLRVWRALADAETGETGRAFGQDDGIEVALRAMPRVLRRTLAARLGLAASDAGLWSRAGRLAALARRSGHEDEARPAAEVLLSARLDSHRTGSKKALRDTAGRSGTGPRAPEAVLLVADAAIEGAPGEALDTRNLRLDLGALARVYRGEPLGRDAFVAEVRLTARALGRGPADELLERGHHHGLVDADTYANVLADLAKNGAQGAPETPLAILYERAPERYAPALAQASFRRALARSFVRIGLPGRGAALLRAEDVAMPELAAALTEANLADGRLDDAAAALARMPVGPERARLAARLAMARGAPLDALDALRPHLGEADPGLVARVAWAAGAWAEAAQALERVVAKGTDPGARARLALARSRAAGSGIGSAAERFAPTAEGIAELSARVAAEADALREVIGDG